MRTNRIKELRNFLELGRKIVTLGPLYWVQKITDISLRAEFTIISDPENKGVNNTEMVLPLIFSYHRERRQLKGN